MPDWFKNITKWFSKERLIYLISLFIVFIGIGLLATRVKVVLQNANEIAFESFKDEVQSQSSLLSSALDLGRSNAQNLSVLLYPREFLLGDKEKFDSAQNVLSQLAENIQGSVFYILDKDGLCILSSDESFLNNNYSFRPYFQEALIGSQGFYTAVGVTSKALGLYYSYPIYENGEIIGVAVYKSTGVKINALLENYQKDEDDFIGISDSNGIIFISSANGSLYLQNTLSQKEIAQLEASKQYPVDDLSLWNFTESSYSLGGANYYEDEAGERFVFYETDIQGYELKLIRLVPYEIINEYVGLVKNEIYWIAVAGVVMFAAFVYLFFLFAKYNREQFAVRQELSEAKETLNETIERLPTGILRTTLNGDINFINKAGLEMFGFKDFAEARRHKITEFYVNVDDRAKILKELKKTKAAHVDQVELYNVDKSRIQFIKADLWLDESGQGLEAAFENVNKEVIASERLKSAALSSSDVIWETDYKGRIVYCSPNVDVTLGYSSEELLGKTLYDFMQGDDAVRAEQKWKSVIERKDDIRDMVNEYLHKDGHVVILEINANKFLDSKGNLQGYRGAAKDLTKIISQQEELKLLSNAVEQSANTILITDVDGNIEYVNEYFENLTGYSRDEIIGENPRILNSDYHDKKFYKTMWDTILSGKAWKGQVRNKRKDGSLFWEESTITPIIDDTGKISHFMAVKENITQRKELEEERALYQLITKNIGEGIYLINEDEGFDYVNKTAANSLQYSVNELVSINLEDLDKDYIKDIWKERILSIKESKQTEMVEATFIAKDGTFRIKELALRYLNYKNKDYLLAIGRDITQRKSEEELEKERVEELEKLNRLTTGREYKVVELQDEIEDLKMKLEKYKKYFGKQ